MRARTINTTRARSLDMLMLIVEKAFSQMDTAMDEEQPWQMDSKSHRHKNMVIV